MTCEDISGLINSYVENDLSEETAHRIEAHLLTCRDCAWETETLRIVHRRLLSERHETIASDAFRARVLIRLRTDNEHLKTTEEGERVRYQLPMPF
jgi:anti-sigma factor RsiW